MPVSRVRILLVWWLACVLWSSAFLFIKLGLNDLPPFTFASLRLVIALIVLIPLALLRNDGRSLTRRDVLAVCFAGVLLLGVNYGLVFWGTQFIPSGLVAILQSTTPVLALAFGWLLGSERVTVRKLLAVSAGVAGVAIIFGAEARVSGRASLVGSAAAFAGAACVALSYVWIKTYARHVSGSAVTALQSVVGLVPLAGLALITEDVPPLSTWSAGAWASLLYLGLVASVVALWMNYWLLQRMDASALLVMSVAEVPIAVALGAVILGERLPRGTLVGAACVLGAVVATLWQPAQPAPKKLR
ncbi:MAG: EamA family transporter [Vicinamibacterales bacterium]